MSEQSPLKPTNNNRLKLCQICKLQPMPESTQYIPFLIAQILFIFLNFKISIILVCVGYFFAKTIWICPMCKREVPVQVDSSTTDDHIIIRLNDCMALVSKTKFRIVSVITILIVTYLHLTEPQIKPKIHVQKTWKSIASNSGFQMYLENSFKANYFYEKYQNEGDWQLQAIYLSRDKPGIKGYVTIEVKMDPSQFSDVEAEDFHVLAMKPQFQLVQGDLIKIYGTWGKRKAHMMVFNAHKIQKLGKKIDLSTISLLGKGYLRQGAGY